MSKSKLIPKRQMVSPVCVTSGDKRLNIPIVNIQCFVGTRAGCALNWSLFEHVVSDYDYIHAIGPLVSTQLPHHSFISSPSAIPFCPLFLCLSFHPFSHPFHLSSYPSHLSSHPSYHSSSHYPWTLLYHHHRPLHY